MRNSVCLACWVGHLYGCEAILIQFSLNKKTVNNNTLDVNLKDPQLAGALMLIVFSAFWIINVILWFKTINI